VYAPAARVTTTASDSCWQIAHRLSRKTARIRSTHLLHASRWPHRPYATQATGSAQMAQWSSSAMAAMALSVHKEAAVGPGARLFLALLCRARQARRRACIRE
jgi:hypothetical protein